MVKPIISNIFISIKAYYNGLFKYNSVQIAKEWRAK